ncbi:MAG: Rpn family recombination-promoting nuclease/putative transposase [Cytophagales bacterium]|nr:Rpn family recombination-promoting nuclease/putative transposase [Cytophagales bacterium]
MKFVNITNDIAFRKIFGNENKKNTLISFLNAVLNLTDDEAVKDVSIQNPYLLPKYSGGKTTIVDVKATDLKGNIFIVEMQVAEAKDFDKRVLYYASQSYTDQIERGDLYANLKPTFFIGILNFDVTQNKNYLSRHRILDVETNENIVKNLEFNFIELNKFKKNQQELTSIIDQWVYFIKNAEDLEVIPETITDEGIKDAFIQADKHNWTKEELQEYNKVFMREQDERGRYQLAIERAEKNAELKGKIQGINEGKIEGKIEVAKNLKINGISMDIIILSTGLTKEEIDKL